MKLNKIYNMDCLAGLKTLPDKFINLCLTDPPYGVKSDKGTNGFGAAKNRKYRGGWDCKIPEKAVFDEIFRVSQNVIIFGGNHFTEHLPTSNCWIFWDKKGAIDFKNPFADGELIYTTFSHVIRKITFLQQGFITDSKDRRYHPTQKPSELVQKLIEDYSKKGDIILDPFIGSGTTAVAAKRAGRRYIGYETDVEFYAICLKRLQAIAAD